MIGIFQIIVTLLLWKLVAKILIFISYRVFHVLISHPGNSQIYV